MFEIMIADICFGTCIFKVFEIITSGLCDNNGAALTADSFDKLIGSLLFTL